MKNVITLVLILAFAWTISPIVNGQDAFHNGSVIAEFGKVASVKSDVELPADTVFKVRFDVDRNARAGEINSAFDSAARFINLHVEAGIPVENIQLAVIVHGSAAFDVTRQAFFGPRHENRPNACESAIKLLQKHRVKFFLCGQSAAFHGITHENLLPGVKMAPSAMTMHALLDQAGYSLNPF